jgi:low affinity Fe/Cu permease
MCEKMDIGLCQTKVGLMLQGIGANLGQVIIGYKVNGEKQVDKMKDLYRNIESVFEKVTAAATIILGSSFGFIIALILVTYWLGNTIYTEGSQHIIRDFIHGFTFLSLFIIQKEFNRFSAALHLKVNELLASNASANNAVINVEVKTEHEITELSKEYAVLAEQAVASEELKLEEISKNTEGVSIP